MSDNLTLEQAVAQARALDADRREGETPFLHARRLMAERDAALAGATRVDEGWRAACAERDEARALCDDIMDDLDPAWKDYEKEYRRACDTRRRWLDEGWTR